MIHSLFLGLFVVAMAALPVVGSLLLPDLKGLMCIAAIWFSCVVGQLAAYQLNKMSGMRYHTNAVGLVGVLYGMVLFGAAIYFPALHILTVPTTVLALGMAASLSFKPGIIKTWKRD